jgi:cephalosporin-C deacetylase-like acetyl esterase
MNMTGVQIAFLVGVLAACAIALIWMLLRARPEKTRTSGDNLGDREQILEMLTRVSDRSGLSAYQKAYNITDQEIMEKRKALAAKAENAGQQA